MSTAFYQGLLRKYHSLEKKFDALSKEGNPEGQARLDRAFTFLFERKNASVRPKTEEMGAEPQEEIRLLWEMRELNFLILRTEDFMEMGPHPSREISLWERFKAFFFSFLGYENPASLSVELLQQQLNEEIIMATPQSEEQEQELMMQGEKAESKETQPKAAARTNARPPETVKPPQKPQQQQQQKPQQQPPQ
ncbi:MAG: hypothetical protein Q4B50_08265, partial [Bacillota bacterium]|nr:hypothetical protein [Bacillota bacterium]